MTRRRPHSLEPRQLGWTLGVRPPGPRTGLLLPPAPTVCRDQQSPIPLDRTFVEQDTAFPTRLLVLPPGGRKAGSDERAILQSLQLSHTLRYDR